MTDATNANNASFGATYPLDEEQARANDNDTSIHANRHIPSFLALKECDDHDDDVLQILTNGKELTAENLVKGKLSISTPILVMDTPSSIGLKVPKASRGSRGGAVTVRDIADIIGHFVPVSVIDVQHQEELDGWTMGDLVDYFEDAAGQRQLLAPQEAWSFANDNRRRRAAATLAMQKQREQKKVRVLNQISLEFSHTPLRKMVQSPRFVRDMDWIDHAWPSDRRDAGDYPVVQYYCLTSTAGCYTDFHVDFGGTAVWYHLLRGEKKFALLEPTREHLQVYEDWLCRPNQAELFLPDLIKGKKVLFVTLKESQTLVIPSGWIHAVYTPVDSVVMGGNFLHSLDISTMLEVYYIEYRTRVPGKFRFPYFLPLMFHAGAMFLRKLQKNVFMCDKELEGLGVLIVNLEGWWKAQADETMVVAAKQAASGCESVEEFLTLLKLERARRMMKGNVETTEKPKLRLKLPSAHDDDDTATSGDTSAKPPQLSPPHQANKPSSLRLKISSPPDGNHPTLKISSPLESKPPASLRIKLPPGVKSEPAGNELDFSISVPSSSQCALPQKRKSAQREGLDEPYPGDEEWEPEIGLKRASQKAKATGTQLKSVVQPKKPKATSRQRLMKRFR